MTKQTKTKFGPQEFDVRVRERFLASGALDPKNLEKHLADLKDVGQNSDLVTLRQPALSSDEEEDEDGDDEGGSPEGTAE